MPPEGAACKPQVVHSDSPPLASTRSSCCTDMRQDVREPSQPPGNNDLEGKWKIAIIPDNCSVEGMNKDLSREKNAQFCSLTELLLAAQSTTGVPLQASQLHLEYLLLTVPGINVSTTPGIPQ